MSDLSSGVSAPASPGSERDEVIRNAQLNASDDSDEEVTTTRKSRKHAAPVDDDDESDVAMGGGDLFGDDSGSEGKQSPKRRKLSDSELDSGDDEGRMDRLDAMEEDAGEQQEDRLMVLEHELDRHGIPRGSDGELYLLRFPQSIGVEPTQFIPGTFQKPTKAHHGAPPSSAFSAAQVANSTIRWRRDPNNPAKLQSNARIVRWSDGSLTLQIASMPMDQFELPAKALAAPQARPLKPTPISDPKKPVKYDPRADSHTYLTSIYPAPNLVQITNHITASLTVETIGDEVDEALIRLQEQLSAAAKGSKGDGGRGPEIVTLTEDPELARKRAEAAERERARADRRRQNQQERERDRAGRVMGRSTGRSGGLTVGGLEDDEDGADSRRRPKAPRKPRRRNSEYSEDEEEGYGRRGGREDEYDKDDGFLVGSDEEIEAEDDDSEEDEFGEVDAEGEDEDDDNDGDRRAAQKSKERSSAGGADEGPRGSRRARRVVDDDDE